MRLCDLILSNHPSSASVPFARLKRLESLYHLRDYQQVLDGAELFLKDIQDPLLQGYVRVIQAEALLKLKRRPEALKILLDEARLRPSYGFGPMTKARDVLGRVCTNVLQDNAEANAATFLRLESEGVSGLAKALAIVGAYRAQQQRYDLAIKALEMMVAAYPSQAEEYQWAIGMMNGSWKLGVKRCRILAE